MKGKILFVAGAAAGYVLGARAGRKRYEQISAAAGKFWNARPVQDVVGTAEGFAKAQFGALGDKAYEVTKSFIGKALSSDSKKSAPQSDVAAKVREASAAAGSGGASAASGTSAS